MDEANRGRKPDPDYAKTEKEIAATEKQIRKLEDLIASEGKRLDNANAENRKKRNQVLDLKDKIIVLMHEGKSKAENLRIEHEMKLNTLNREIQTAENDILRLKDAVEFNQANIKRLADRNDTLREQWREINESTLEFDDKTFCCPTCHRPLEADDVEKEKAQLLGKFNIDKAQKLEDIAGKGNANKEGIERLQAENNKHQLEIRQLEDKIRDKKIEIKVATDSYQKPVEKTEPNPLIKKYQEQIEELEATIAPNDTINTKDLTIETAGLREKLEELKDLMKIRKHNQEIAERLIELQQQQRDFSQQIADLERQEFKIEKFNRLKAEITEERVNGRFEYVKFKLFNNQVNGGTEETCEAMVNGVPFQGANNAAKINAGIDIINAFSKDFDIYAPIFTDNAEAVNQLLDSPSQMITLYVTKDKELKITHKN
jgi:chromosome segregation ATPase